MRVERIGYGMGRKDFPAANCVRALLGETEDSAEDVLELACNLDDMTPEAIGFALERLLEAGALDAWTTPIGMKKSRPGVLLRALCRPEKRQAVLDVFLRDTSTAAAGRRCSAASARPTAHGGRSAASRRAAMAFPAKSMNSTIWHASPARRA